MHFIQYILLKNNISVIINKYAKRTSFSQWQSSIKANKYARGVLKYLAEKKEDNKCMYA